MFVLYFFSMTPYTLLAIKTVDELMWQQRLEEIRVKIYLLIRLGHLTSQLFFINLLFKRNTVNMHKYLTC